MLGDDHLGRALVGRVAVVDLVAVEEHHDVRVLLEAAALAQVGEHRALVGAGLEVSAELAEGDDRHLELAGEDLQATADLADLELAVLGVRPAAHQLQVVDDDQRQARRSGPSSAAPWRGSPSP